mmetsp:Transcript_24433/g.27174  ORF Transcript_24433/g.27174 Transcript_24433/m.27174 type:complete len:303 (+) Transcript_24433:465-1373(+)
MSSIQAYTPRSLKSAFRRKREKQPSNTNQYEKMDPTKRRSKPITAHYSTGLQFSKQDEEAEKQRTLRVLKIQSSVKNKYVMDVKSLKSKLNGFSIIKNRPVASIEELGQRQKLDQRDIAYICKSVTKGIKALRNKNIVHRNIKGESIKVMGNGRVKIGDFGKATFKKNLAQDGKRFIGTFGYVDPAGEILYTVKMDTYAIGTLAMELALGRREPPQPTCDSFAYYPDDWKLSKKRRNDLVLLLKQDMNVFGFLLDFVECCSQTNVSTKEILKHPFIKLAHRSKKDFLWNVMVNRDDKFVKQK